MMAKETSLTTPIKYNGQKIQQVRKFWRIVTSNKRIMQQKKQKEKTTIQNNKNTKENYSIRTGERGW